MKNMFGLKDYFPAWFLLMPHDLLILRCNNFELSYRELGIKTVVKCKNGQEELFKLAQTMFDTKLPPGVTMLQPFSEDSSIKKISVKVGVWHP